MVWMPVRCLAALSLAAALPGLSAVPSAAAPAAKASVVGLRVTKAVSLGEKPERAVQDGNGRGSALRPMENLSRLSPG